MTDDETLRRLRVALHEDIEIVTEDGTVLEGPGGTQLVNGDTHEVERWIDRRSRWGNPFKACEHGGDYDRYEAVELYKGYLLGQIETGAVSVQELRGAVLGCWCLPELCHGVIVLNRLAETYSPQQTLATDGGQKPAEDGEDISRPPLEGYVHTGEPVSNHATKNVLLVAEHGDTLRVDGHGEMTVHQRTDTYFGPKLKLYDDETSYKLVPAGFACDPQLWEAVGDEYIEGWKCIDEVSAEIVDVSEAGVCECGETLSSLRERRAAAFGVCIHG